jgi:hypothetical protein
VDAKSAGLERCLEWTSIYDSPDEVHVPRSELSFERMCIGFPFGFDVHVAGRDKKTSSQERAVLVRRDRDVVSSLRGMSITMDSEDCTTILLHVSKNGIRSGSYILLVFLLSILSCLWLYVFV